METSGDLWIHSDRTRLWWTISAGEAPLSEIRDDPDPAHGLAKIVVYYKPCQPWSCKDRMGRELFWSAIHPKAKGFLTNMGTFQSVLGDNALYAEALINGDDLSDWHLRRDWQAKEERSGKGAVKTFSPEQIAAKVEADRMMQTAQRMAQTAWDTTLQSGQISQVVQKDKMFRFFSKSELAEYTLELMAKQRRICALTGLTMILDDEQGDLERRFSLDRIDSSGHYERGNLQVVCKFANRWKCASDNGEFKRLISLISRQE
jgi:hypothetical protein